jgi:hypothetical protein
MMPLCGTNINKPGANPQVQAAGWDAVTCKKCLKHVAEIAVVEVERAAEIAAATDGLDVTPAMAAQLDEYRAWGESEFSLADVVAPAVVEPAPGVVEPTCTVTVVRSDSEPRTMTYVRHDHGI